MEAAPLEREKAAAARAAVARVRSGMRLALGTGTTTAFAVRAIAERFPDGGGITAVASSRVTERLAQELNFPVRPLQGDDVFDLMVDGADEVTPQLDLTKGGGGALLREKLLARLSKELVVIVDHTKLVQRLGERVAIPVEVVPFARPVVEHRLKDRRFGTRLRVDGPTHTPWMTDNGNEVLDVTPPTPVENPRLLDSELKGITGVVETGIFCGLARRVYVGLPDGRVEEILPAHPPTAAA